jgi:putative two-component system response regulator
MVIAYHGRRRAVMTGKILVADDESAARSGLELLLRRQGYDVISVENGHAALEQCACFRPDLVLLDVVMPGLDGFAICQRLKADPETRLTPVVLITGLSATEDRIQGIQAGADDFLSKPLDRTELLARVGSLLKLKAYTDELEHAESVMFSLALSLEARDPYTHGHCERLSNYSARLGERLGLEPGQITALRRSGILHDIGKVVVPDAILLKQGPLTPGEEGIMRQHPIEGERICTPLKCFHQILPIIRCHHEKLDGSGYPDGLKGEQIPLTAQILQIVDVYDALTTERSYRNALSSGEALNIMEDEVNRGWRDAHLFAQFRQMLKQNGGKKHKFWKELLLFAPSESSALLAAQTGQRKRRARSVISTQSTQKIQK